MSAPEQMYYKNTQTIPTSQYNTVRNNVNTTSCVQNTQNSPVNNGQVQQHYPQGYCCYYPPFVPMYQPAVQTQQTQAIAVPQPNIQPAGQTVTPVQSQNTYWPQAYCYPPIYTQPMANNGAQVPATTAGVNIQIINPAVNAGGCPVVQGGQTQVPPTTTTPPPTGGNGGNGGDGANGTCGPNGPTNPPPTENKKTEKRKIVQLSDNYIKSLENYLNSQDKANRISGAKEVFARLEEDDSRANDKALTALINKMLQDPTEEVRFIALTALDQRSILGDQKTAEILKQMQNSKAGFGEEARDASRILLKMSGEIVEKEFEVKEDKKPKSKNTLYE